MQQIQSEGKLHLRENLCNANVIGKMIKVVKVLFCSMD